jgi:hypothetical protein
MAEQGFWPLYEGKHIEQSTLDYAPVERWVSLEAAISAGKAAAYGSPRAAFRDIASNTNERTCIAAALPGDCFYSYTLRAILADDIGADAIVTLLNVLPVDFSIRMRTVGAHQDFAVMGRVAVLPPDTMKRLKALPTESASPHPAARSASWPGLWAANRAVAEAYGLGPDDFEHILSTFPVFARKRPALCAYLQERLAEWKEVGVAAKRPLRTWEPGPPISRVAEPRATYGGEPGSKS